MCAGAENVHLDDVSDPLVTVLGEVHYAVVVSPPLPVSGIPSAGPVDEDGGLRPDQPLVELQRNAIGHREQAVEPVLFFILRKLFDKGFVALNRLFDFSFVISLIPSSNSMRVLFDTKVNI